MIGRIVSAMAGRSLARNTAGGMGGIGGAAIGAALPTLMRRMGPMGMIAAAAGGYAVKRMVDKRRAQAAIAPRATSATTARPATAPYRSAPTIG